jgi:hypothetical protein
LDGPQNPISVDMQTVDGTEYVPVLPVSRGQDFASRIKGVRDPFEIYRQGVASAAYGPKAPLLPAGYGTMDSQNSENMMGALLKNAQAGRVPFQIGADKARTAASMAQADLDRTKSRMGGFAPKVVRDKQGNVLRVPAMGAPQPFGAEQTGLQPDPGGGTGEGAYNSQLNQLYSEIYPPGRFGEINKMKDSDRGVRAAERWEQAKRQFLQAKAIGMSPQEARMAGMLDEMDWRNTLAKAGIDLDELQARMQQNLKARAQSVMDAGQTHRMPDGSTMAGPEHPGAVPGSTTQDPIAQRIEQLRQQGMSDAEIAKALREKGINPAQYGIDQRAQPVR